MGKKKIYILFFMFLLNSYAYSEFKVITEYVAGKDADGNNIYYQMGGDSMDIEACEAIKNNINELNKYDVSWGCGVPISSNSYLLSKPKWKKISGIEKKRSVKTLLLQNPSFRKLPEDDPLFEKTANDPKLEVYSYPIDIGGRGGLENMYIMPDDSLKSKCPKEGFFRDSTTLWFANLDGSEVEGFDFQRQHFYPILFSERVYFLNYSSGKYNEPEGFSVSKLNLRKTDGINAFKHISSVCSILP